MKKLLMAVLLLSLLVSFSFAQWEVVKQETGNEIAPDDGFFIDANTGWMIGDYANDGAVWKTTDAGLNWTEVRAADESGIQWRNIEFFDADTGYACADDGYIFKTVDGGVNWTMVGDTANYKADLKDVAVVSADVVYFSGMDWTVLKTTDGGGSYVAQGDSTTFQGADLDGGIDFTDADNGVVIADGSGGLTWYTHDGGTNWNFVSVGPLFPQGLSSSRIYDVAINGLTVVIGAYHYCIFISTDGGETYSRSGDFTYENERFLSISLIDANTIYIGGTLGNVVKTVDGGANWDTLYVGSGQDLKFLDFVDANNGYVISKYDQWFKTTDGGANFTPLLDWPGINFWGMALPADDKIVVTAEDGGEMTVSEDGGITWSYPVNNAIGVIENIYACEFADANNGMVAGSSTLKKTVDGGATWTKLANPIEDIGKSIYSINYENVDTVFIGGTSGNIFYSYDGGTTWMGDDYGSGYIYDIWKISDTQIIAAVSDGKIYNSSVIGDSLSFAEVEDYGDMYMEAVEFRGDVGIVVAKKGHIYRTTVAEWDTLVEVFTDPAGDDFYDIEFIDDNLVYVVGEAGKIYKSEDAGLNWTSEVCSNTEELHKVRFRNNKLWAVGDAATILLLDMTPEPVVVTLAVEIPGDGSYRSFWVNGSWDNNGAYDSDWSGDMVELTDADGDNIFVGTVGLMLDSTNTYSWWLGAENSTSTYVKSGADFQVLSSDPVFTDTLEIPSPWIITMPGSLNSWDPSDQNLTRTETVWASDSIFIAAGTAVEYKYAVGLSWHGDTNPFQTYGAEGYNAGGNITFTSETDALYIFAFDDADDSCTVTLVKQVGIEDAVALPKVFKVHQNYPNPFNPTTTMKFDLPKESRVSIHIYNMLGENVRTLADNKLFNAGYHQVIWNGVNNNGDQLSSGIYFYQVRTENNLKTNRMLLLK